MAYVAHNESRQTKKVLFTKRGVYNRPHARLLALRQDICSARVWIMMARSVRETMNYQSLSYGTY